MTTLQLYPRQRGLLWYPGKYQPLILLFLLLFLLWESLPLWIYRFDATIALPDAGIWPVYLLSIVFFFIFLFLSLYVYASLSKTLGFPSFLTLVPHFKSLSLWQQFAFYLLGYALLFWGMIACLIALC